LEVHEYPQTNISGAIRRFNHEWFDDVYHDWLEYSVSKDAAYCLYCYLFKDHNLIKVEVKYFHVQDLRIGIKRVVLTNILVCRIAHIIDQKRNVRIYYGNNGRFNLHLRDNLIKLNMDIISV